MIRQIFTATLISLAIAGGAHAASIENADTEDRIITVTVDGARQEVVVPTGGTVEVCPEACFLSFPSGDMMALKGAENVVIEGGRGRIR